MRWHLSLEYYGGRRVGGPPVRAGADLDERAGPEEEFGWSEEVAVEALANERWEE